jgi:hypothetical protein
MWGFECHSKIVWAEDVFKDFTTGDRYSGSLTPTEININNIQGCDARGGYIISIA